MRRRDDKFPDNGFEAWGGYMNAKIAKLEEQFCVRSEKEDTLSNIFNGVSIYVNGFTDPSADELKTLMSHHGGIYHTYQRSEDFIIASNLPDTKVKKMSLSRVVKPQWITESIAANRLLDFRDYLLFKTSRNQQHLDFNKYNRSDVTCSSVIDAKDTINSTNCASSSTNLQNETVAPNQKLCDSASIENTSEKFDIKQNVQQATMAKTAADPNFISEFYNNSRLHHISQLGACFKQHVNDIRENSNFTFPERLKLRDAINCLKSNKNLSQIRFEKGKTIMHIDMDCFFVSVGLRSRPDLRGKPVAVTHSKGGQPKVKRPGVDRNTEFNLYKQKQAKKIGKATGKPEDEIELETRVDNLADEDEVFGSMSEIASCSYEARAKGVGNGMFMGPALRLCPDLQTIPYDFEGYKEVAYTLYNTIAQYTLDIEAVSCDEMYVDCTELLKELNVSVQDFATAVRDEIKTKTGCPCSTGFGGNRLQARLATKRAKPDGQFFLSEDLVEDYMFDIKLKDLPGVGRQTSQKLESLGHTTCGSLQQMSLASLKCHLGVKTGAQLFDQCRGRDPNPLSFHTVRKSVSAEVNYGIRFENNEQCTEFLKQLATEVNLRMQQFKVVGKCITLKLMVRAEDAPVETAKFMGHGFCDVINKSTTLTNATNDAEVITKEVLAICKKLNIDPKEMRGVGIQVTKLESTVNKQVKGAMSKFLCPKSPSKAPKSEINNDTLKSSTSRYNNNIIENGNTEIKKYDSPKKLKIEISPKKSPIVGQGKSPIKKRGRPPKNCSTHKSSSKNIMSKFLQGQGKDIPFRNPMIKSEPLPVEIKEKPILKAPDKVYKENNTENARNSGLLGLPWNEVRELLRAWLESGQTPLPCDVNLISEYMQDMVVKKNLEKLNVLVNFLKRRTHEMSNVRWIEVYDQVMIQVQNAMIAIYGKQLYIDD